MVFWRKVSFIKFSCVAVFIIIKIYISPLNVLIKNLSSNVFCAVIWNKTYRYASHYQLGFLESEKLSSTNFLFCLIKKETKKSSLNFLVRQISFRILKEKNSLRSNSFSFYVFFKHLTLDCGS
ncbi:MAG: hypothetical protein ACI9L6_000895 [Flavobacterium sp.]|jgi:hypothetical protein